MDIYIAGVEGRNRAFNGDRVAVALNPPNKWKVNSLITYFCDHLLFTDYSFCHLFSFLFVIRFYMKSYVSSGKIGVKKLMKPFEIVCL